MRKEPPVERIVVTKEVEVDTIAEVTVDVTAEVAEWAKDEAERRYKELVEGHARSVAGLAFLDVNTATVGVLRQARRGTTPAGVLRLLVDLIGSDHLRREIDTALRNSSEW